MAERRVQTTPSGAHPCSGQGLQCPLNQPSCNSSLGKTHHQNMHSILEGNTKCHCRQWTKLILQLRLHYYKAFCMEKQVKLRLTMTSRRKMVLSKIVFN